MGFFDKVKEKAQQIKEDNKNFTKTMSRMNDWDTFYGWVNASYSLAKMDSNDDFAKGSYINIIDGRGVIYSTSRDDYFFNRDDILDMKFTGSSRTVQFRKGEYLALCFIINFRDGKLARVDILAEKVDHFREAFDLK